MSVRIFFKSDKNSNASMSFLDVEAQSWSASPIFLTIVQNNGTVRYYPLINIESFMEV
jgi:hypothetical protein